LTLLSDIKDLIGLFQTINATRPVPQTTSGSCAVMKALGNQEMFSYFWRAKWDPERKRAVPRKVSMEQSVHVPPVIL
jgi:hypothetical protein